MFKFRKCFTGLVLGLAITASSLLSPLTVTATSTQTTTAAAAEKTPAQLEMERIYGEAIQSNNIKDWPQGPQVYAESAIVMDTDTGAILYAKNIDEQLYPASITKIMTTLLAIENSSPDEWVTFSDNAINSLEWGCSRIGIRVGETITMKDCLYGMMLESANEVCLGVAEHISGSVDKFVDLMNEKAEELGCTNTHFSNPNGMPDETHVTTVHDMALISMAAIHNETFKEVTGTLSYQIGWTNKAGEIRYLNQHHKMLKENSGYYYQYAIGGKTGYTTAALNTLVTFASKDGRNLVCVTMKTNGAQYYTDTAKLLDYGFDSFKNTTPFATGSGVGELAFPALMYNTTPTFTIDTADQQITLPKGIKKSKVKDKVTIKNGKIIHTYTYKKTKLGTVTTEIPQFMTDITLVSSSASAKTRSDNATIKSKKKTSSAVSSVASVNSLKGVIAGKLTSLLPERARTIFSSLETWQLGLFGVLILVIVFYIIMLIRTIQRAMHRHKYKKMKKKRKLQEQQKTRKKSGNKK